MKLFPWLGESALSCNKNGNSRVFLNRLTLTLLTPILTYLNSILCGLIDCFLLYLCLIDCDTSAVVPIEKHLCEDSIEKCHHGYFNPKLLYYTILRFISTLIFEAKASWNNSKLFFYTICEKWRTKKGFSLFVFHFHLYLFICLLAERFCRKCSSKLLPFAFHCCGKKYS